MVDEFGWFHWNTPVRPKLKHRESGVGKSLCISWVSFSDHGVKIWGRPASGSAGSNSGTSGVPERVQFHFGIRRAPSSFLNIPVWGMLNKLAEWWKETLLSGLFGSRGPGNPPGWGLAMVVAWYTLVQDSRECS